MKTDVSFIISIDSSFEMVNNFFEHLLQDEFALSSEIIVVLDAITNSCTIEYIKQLNDEMLELENDDDLKIIREFVNSKTKGENNDETL